MRSCAQSSQRSTWPPSAEVRRGLDRRHDLQLGEAHVTGVGLPPRRPMGAKDVGDLEERPRHAALGQPGRDRFVRLTPSRSSGLLMSRTVLTATRV